MKKNLILLAFTLMSTATFARDYGSISLNDGKNILRIDIGSEKETNARQLSQRIVRLEKAVRELQNRVYDLEDNSEPARREVQIFTCILPTSFHGVFIGKARTISEAQANASNNCRKGGSGFCDNSRITNCETSIEIEK